MCVRCFLFPGQVKPPNSPGLHADPGFESACVPNDNVVDCQIWRQDHPCHSQFDTQSRVQVSNTKQKALVTIPKVLS